MTTPREKKCPLSVKDKIAEDLASFLLLFEEMKDRIIVLEDDHRRIDRQVNLLIAHLAREEQEYDDAEGERVPVEE